MKRQVTLLILAVLTWVGVQAQGLPELMYYKFDTGPSIVNDASSPVGTNPASITGTGMSVGGTGLFATALVGTGTNSGTDFVSTGWATNFTGSWTIGFWTSNIDPGSTLWYIFGDLSAGSMRCFTNGVAGANNWLLRATGMPDITANNAATTAPTYTHFVYDATAGDLKSYVNGVLDETVPVPTPIVLSGTDFKVGAYGSSSNLSGLMDEFRIYNRALTQAEISATISGPISLAPCATATVDSAVATPQQVCVGQSTALSATNISFGQGTQYQWQSSLDGIAWANMVNDTAPSILLTVTDTMFYRLIVTCGSSADTSTSVRVDALGTPLAAGVYTINSNSPTAGTNFQSFTEFITSIECAGILGPVTLNVVPGSGPYNERLVFDNVPFNAAAFLTINGNGETIEFSNTTSDRAIIELINTNHITFDSLVVKTLDNTFGWGFWFNETADSNTIKNCIIDVSSVTSTLVNNSAGVVMSNTNTSVTTAGNNGNFNLIENNTFIGDANGGAYSGVIIIGNTAGGSQGNIVRNNAFTDFHLWGIRATSAINTLIDGNVLSRPNRSATGIVRPIYLTGSSDGVIISNNRIFNLTGGSTGSTSTIYGISNNAGATQAAPTLVFNNKIYGFDAGGIHYGIYNAAAWSNYYHNTVVLDGTTSRTQATYGFYTTTASNDNLEVFNNIFYMDRNTTGLQYAIRVNTATVTNFNSNNNGFFIGPNATGIGFRTTGQITLTDWTNATGDDVSSVETDPFFVSLNTGDLTPTSAVMAAIGQNLLSIVPTDFFGNPRLALPSPGAIEFAPPPCPPPGVNLVSATDTSATFGFTIIGSNGTYDIEWGPTGFVPGTGTMLTHTGDTLLLGGLQGSTCYDIYVQLDCTANGDGMSIVVGPFTFCTECTSLNAPYFQGFETWTEGPMPGTLELCYDFTSTNVNYLWEIGEGASPIPNTSGPLQGANNSLKYAFVRASGTANSEAIFSLPAINTDSLSNPELRFFYHVFGNNLNEFRAEVFNETTQQWDSVFAVTQNVQTAQADPFEEAIIPLVNYKSDETKIRFVGIRGNGTSGQYAIDDISVAEAPACPTPIDLDTTANTPTTATLEWLQTGNVSEWEIEWGPVGFTQGTAGANTIAANSNPFTITGLTPGDCYDAYVRANCSATGSGFSAGWAGPLTFCLPTEYDIDLVEVLSPINNGCGDSILAVSALIRNVGTLDANNFDVNATITAPFAQTLSTAYTGTLLSGATDSVFIGFINFANGGILNMSVEVDYSLDQDLSNNNITDFYNIASIAPSIILADKDTLCPGEQVWLYTPFIDRRNNEWFDANSNLIGTGDSIQVGTISAPTQYFISPVAGGFENVGPKDTTIGAVTNFTALSAQSLLITVNDEVTIEEATIYPGSAGDLNIEIRPLPTGSAPIITQTISVPAPSAPGQPVRISLGLTLQPGDYQFGANTNSTVGGLLRNGGGAVYPYSSSNNEFVITGNTFSPDFYYYYYDVLVSTGVPCQIDGDSITLYPSTDTAFATFVDDLASGTGLGPNGFEVNFDAAGSVGTNFTWDFGDGNTGTGLTASNTYLTNGTYTVTFVAEGACGNDTVVRNLTIAGISTENFAMEASLNVFPNPSTGQFHVEFEMEGVQEMYLRVLSPTGQVIVEEATERASALYRKTLDLGAYAKGVYILQIQTENGIVSRRLSLM
ncbi:MAG: PKD domain-containing protein [Schleiferiaceae bacterium]|nr:PKD domain-containing protein [Schleiferiaceae bacterium]